MDDYPASGDSIPTINNNEADVDVQHHELMEFLMDNPDMRKTARSSAKQGLWAGGAAVAGGMMFGPVGGMVGGIAGSVVGFLQSDPYDGAVSQLLEQTDADQKRKLVASVGQILTKAGATASTFASAEAFRAALLQFVSQKHVRDQLWQACLAATNSN